MYLEDWLKKILIIVRYCYHRFVYKLARDPFDLFCIDLCRDQYTFLSVNKNKKTFYVIGDSHTDVFSKNKFEKKRDIGCALKQWFLKANYCCAPMFITYHLGAVTAYGSFSSQSSTRCKEKINYLIENGFLPKKCNVILSFGEIDCRVHILRQAELMGIPWQQVVCNVVQHYSRLICFLNNKGFNVFVYGPVGSQSDEVGFDPSYPRYGNEKIRNEITKNFTDCLIKFCSEKNIPVISILTNLVSNDLTTNDKFYRDGVHLNDEGRELLMDELVKLHLID